MANKKKKARKLKSRMADLAEELGTFLGTSERKAKGWMSEHEKLTKKLTAIRDQASGLLSKLGTAAKAEVSKAKAAKAEAGKGKEGKAKAGKGKDGKAREAKAKTGKAKASDAKASTPAPAKAKKAPKPPVAKRVVPAIDEADTQEPL